MSRRSAAARRRKAVVGRQTPGATRTRPISQPTTPQWPDRQPGAPRKPEPAPNETRPVEQVDALAGNGEASLGAREARATRTASSANGRQSVSVQVVLDTPNDAPGNAPHDDLKTLRSPVDSKWPMLPTGPTTVPVPLRPRDEVLENDAASSGRAPRERSPRFTLIEQPVASGPDGLLDTWPGDMPLAARWWWNVRLAAERAFANLRQGRFRWPGSLRPTFFAVAVGALAVMALAGGATYLAVLRHPHVISLPSLAPGAAAQPTTGIVLQSSPGEPAATVVVPPFTAATWVSNSAPPTSGQVQVYVRVTDTANFAPQTGVSVSLSVAFTCAFPNTVRSYGPATTNADGLAAFTVTYAGLPVGQPVCITATARGGGQAYTATATFAASGGAPVLPTPTPPDGSQPSSTPTPIPCNHPCR